MKNCKLLLLVLFTIVTVSCTASIDGRQNESQTDTPYVANPPTMSATVVPLPSLTEASNLVVTPLPTPVAFSPATDLSTPDIQPSSSIYQQCDATENKPVNELNLTRGLTFLGQWDIGVGLGIMGDTDFRNPAYFLSDAQYDYMAPSLSANGEWFIKTFYEGQQLSSGTITNPTTHEQIQTSFETPLTVANFAHGLQWLNGSQLIIELQNEGQNYSLFVWSPFTGDEEIISTALTGIAPLELYYVPPKYDPLVELVVYLCDSCDQEKYLVKDLRSGQELWSIDLDPEPKYPVRGEPAWSPDGEYLAVTSGPSLNWILVFNRQGEKVQEIILPETSVVTTEMLRWSSNNQYISAVRRAETPGGTITETVFYTNILGDGSVVDLCADPSYGPFWSPVGTKLAYTEQVLATENRYIIVLDVVTGESIRILYESNLALIGWMKLTPP